MTESTWQSLKESADRARKSVNYEKAIDFYTHGLAQSELPWEAFVAMTLDRAFCHEMLGDILAMDAELTDLVDIAVQHGDEAVQVEALSKLSDVLRFIGEHKRALQLGKQAVQIAEQSNQSGLKVQALCALARAQAYLLDINAAEVSLSYALSLADPSDVYHQILLCLEESDLAIKKADYPRAQQAAEQGLQSARVIGDRVFEGKFLDFLGYIAADMAVKGSYWEQALVVFETVGARLYHNTVLLCYSSWQGEVGMIELFMETGRRALEAGRLMHSDANIMTAVSYLGAALGEQGEFHEAEVYLNEQLTLALKTNDPSNEFWARLLQGLFALYQSEPQAALNLLPLDVVNNEQNRKRFRAAVLACQALAIRMFGDAAESRRLAHRAQELISPEEFGTQDVGPDEILWWCYRALSPKPLADYGTTITAERWKILDSARRAMMAPLENMSDAGLRRNYLHGWRFHRELTRAWIKHAPEHGAGVEQMASFAAQLQMPGRLDDIFHRLLNAGARLNVQRNPVRLPEQIVEEVQELTGAERIALVLYDKQGRRKLVKTKLPRLPFPVFVGRVETKPDPDVFLAEIEPWLEEAAGARQGFIRQLNPDALLLEQRSLLVTPLISQGRLGGVIYCDLTGCFGRFDPEDLSLLSVLANQSAVALDNADWSATLEQKVEQRTEELKLSNNHLEQRTTELTIINRVQEGLVKQLDFQAVIDLVGDELIRVFPTPKKKAHLFSVFIALYDPQNCLIQIPYWMNGVGERIHFRSLNLGEGLTSKVIKTRQPLVIKNWDEAIANGAILFDCEEDTQSFLGVPILVSDKVTGAICVVDPRKNFFNKSDVRLLSTLAASLGTALENARLFDETQRLLKETEQRNAELAIINSVQAALAAELDIQGIYDVVGDKIQEIFHTCNVDIRIFDPKTNIISFPYLYENGQRFNLEQMSLPEKGFAAHVIRSRETLVINENMKQAMDLYGSYILPGTLEDKSNVWVPIVVGDQARGLVCLSDYEHENAFSDSDVRLLQTLVNSMSVALQNARLFNETQRLLRETEQRNAELAILNSVSEALSKQLDVDAIIKIVGDKVRDIFQSEVVTIHFYEPKSNLITAPYAYDRGYVNLRPIAFGEGLASKIIQSLQPLVLLNTKEDEKLGVVYGPSAVDDTYITQSYLGVPIIAGDAVLGVVTVQCYKENAYQQSHVNLLTTLASSMGVAIQNARLFQAEQERVAELEIIGSIQQGLAKELDFQAIVDLVGDKLREVFQSTDMMISWYDEKADLARHLYIYERGRRLFPEPTKLSMPGSLFSRFTKNRQPEVWNTKKQNGTAPTVPGTETSTSGVAIPIISGDKIIGGIQLFSMEKENAFGESELRLLTTIAASLGTALENAHLFEETQRLLKETKQRAAELAALAEVSREISATLEFQEVLERIVGQARELLSADTSAVYLLQPHGKTIKAIAAKGTYAQEVLADETTIGNGIIGSIVKSGIAEWVDDTLKDSRSVHIPGTDESASGEKLLVAPLLIKDKAIGALSVWRNPGYPEFNQAELNFAISLAQQAAVAIENARLFETAQESQRRMADIINFLPDPTLVIDKEGRVIAWNHAIEEMTGVSALDMIGKGDFEYALPFYGERRPLLINTVLSPNKEIEAKYTRIHLNEGILVGEAIASLKGRKVYLNVTASSLRNSKGEVVGAIESIRDITAQKLAEQEITQAKAEAEAANQAKSAFLAMMSHEIRTPMNAIIGMSGLLMNTNLNPEQQEFAETIRSSSDSLLSIINDILDFSKIEAGKMSLEEAPFELRECIETSLDLIKVRASEKNLELAYQLEPDVPPAIMGDVTRLRQVLINLLGNSVKFTEQGEIVLSVSKGPEPDSLHFSVRDTGIGIPADRISMLFRPFTQADASTSRRYGGTGLGLALSSRIVNLMGGKIWVESEGIVGRGSTFHFTIIANPVLGWKGRPQLEKEHPQLRGKRLLIVDDNATNRRILQLQTRIWGMHPVECPSPDQALEILRRGDMFDLVIIDMHMPDMNGVELAHAIRNLEADRPEFSQMPLVLSTSLGGRDDAREATEFTAILLKPIRQSALFDTLMNIISKKYEATVKPSTEGILLDPGMAARHPLRILLAEDNLVNQKLALRLLMQMGYRADVAADGLEVLQAVYRQPYDVILMDVQMPEIDGIEATRRLCSEFVVGKRPHIIAMTANAMQGDREMCLEAGMDDYLSKPIRINELVAALNHAKALSG
jgi:PAS domain S-box-containing protein